MRKVAILIHQYGNDVVGGAESYAKSLAEHLAKYDNVTVLTTTSNDYSTWSDFYSPGREIQNGVELIRFSTEKARNKKFADLCNQLNSKLSRGENTTYAEDFKWVEWEGPYCPAIIQYLEDSYDKYDVFVFITYIYYIAVKGIPKVFDKAVFIPTAHDETWLRLSIMKDLFRMPRYLGFLTEEERKLVHERFNNDYIPSDILGIGIEIPTVLDAESFKIKFHIENPYLIYVGRIDASKGCDELIRFFLGYKKNYPSNLKLVLVGKGHMDVPKSKDIIVTGFVSEQEKYDAIAGAFAMVTPSRYESLCISLLEAMALKIPVIANAHCAVLKGQCIRSNAGLYYNSEDEFALVLEYLHTHHEVYKQMGENGFEYIKNRYTWELVISKVRRMVEDVCCFNDEVNSFSKSLENNQYKIWVTEPDMQIAPVDKEAITIVTSSDNNYADFVAITINSIIKNASVDSVYDILVFTNDITEEKICEILFLAKERKNIHIRFVYLSSVIQKLDIKISANYNEVTYFRLLIPQMMKKYKKIIYLDSDIILNEDIEELWGIELESNLLAATSDLLITSWQNYDSGMQAYFESLGIDAVGKYIQAGVILWNIEEMNREFPMNYLLKQSCENQYMLADQDILNIFCKNRIKYINQAWNVLNLSEDGERICSRYLPRFMMRRWINAKRSPKAIHFCESSFPCWKERKFSQYYWKYAWETPFYDALVHKKLERIQENISYCKKAHIDTHTESGLTLKYNDNVEIKSGCFVMHSGGKIYGPNIFLGKGEHTLILECDMKKTAALKLQITSGARHILLASCDIRSGKQKETFKCLKNQIDVEILIENNLSEDVFLKEIALL